MNYLQIILIFTMLASVFSIKSYTKIIPSQRRIIWEGNVGIPRGIPERSTIYKTFNSTTFGNGSTDATGAIQSALDNCPKGQAVFLSAGKYRIESNLSIPDSVTLRGAGPSETILYAYGTATAVLSFGHDVSPSNAPHTPVTAGLEAGSKILNLKNTDRISVGSLLMITQLNDTFVTTAGGGGACTWCDGWWGWDGTRAMGQMTEVTSVNGTEVGISPGLYYTYSEGLSPLASPIIPGARYAGIEDLQVYMNKTGYTANFYMCGSAYCWIKNVESNYTDGDHVQVHYSYRCEIRDSYFHDAFAHVPGQTDADVFIASKSSGILVENNILRRLHASIMLNWGASGNVIAYNFADGNMDDRAPNVLMGNLSMHGSHPMFNLYEGNIVASINSDGIWGSSSHNTLFRNWCKGTTKICEPMIERGTERSDSTWWAVQANRAIVLDFACRYYNLIGNVVGSKELLSITSYNNGTKILPMKTMTIAPATRAYDSETYGYSFGYGGGGGGDDGTWKGDNDLPYKTAIIHGDYNFSDKSVYWDPTITSHELPASLYLTTKPEWYGSIPWPSIGPDVDGFTGRIPAQIRWEDKSISKTRKSVYRNRSGITLDLRKPGVLLYHLPENTSVKLYIFDASGKIIKTLIRTHQMAGDYKVNYAIKKLSPGVYFCKLYAEKFLTTVKRFAINK